MNNQATDKSQTKNVDSKYAHRGGQAYFTTPIFYPTGDPHIGTAYTAFIADTFTRYAKSQGKETFFITGTDEHGGNIAKLATELGKTPQQLVDEKAESFINTWAKLGISNDYFIRTTNPEHEKFAQELMQKSYDNGDIYAGEYEGWYCDSCEAYYTEKDLVDAKCPNHPTKTPRWSKEENYYFKLSKYRDWLLEWYESNPEWVRPAKWAKYVVDLVEAGLNDIPITRANVSWGIPVPFAPEQTIYVWYDALPNYLSTLHFDQFAGHYDKFWEQATHVIGKEITKFHAILWPAMLKSAGYPLPKHILVHGFFTVGGQKIGKSNGNAINPVEFTKEYPVDAVRYALLSEFQLGADGDFSPERLKVKYETELGGKWGNLLNRVLHLAAAKDIKAGNGEWQDIALGSQVDEVVGRYHTHMQAFEVFEAIQAFNELTSLGNKYIADHKPWEKSDGSETAVLQDLLILLNHTAELATPILPDSAAKAKTALETGERVILFPKLA